MSHWLYIHKDLSSDPDWNKIGVTLTPYSAVRARQKNCSKPFCLDHLYFGREGHIDRLETDFKKTFGVLSGRSLTDLGQTELFKVSQQDMINWLNSRITDLELQVFKVQLTAPYTASKSSDCPLNVPSESTAWEYCQKLVKQTWGKDQQEILIDKLFGREETC